MQHSGVSGSANMLCGVVARAGRMGGLGGLGVGFCVAMGAAHAQSVPDDHADRLTSEQLASVRLFGGPTAFSERGDPIFVYGTPVDLRGYTDGGFPKRSGDDVEFGGLAASFEAVSITQAYFAIVVPAGSTLSQTTVRFTFYDVLSGWTNGTFPASGAIGSAIADSADPVSGWAALSPIVIVPNRTMGTDCFVVIESLLPGTTQLHPTNWIAANGPNLLVGNSDPLRWGDSNGNATINDGEVNPSSTVRRLYLGLGGFEAFIGTECGSIDFNNDGAFFDPTDIDAFLSVYSEGPCVPASEVCDTIDFNGDGTLFDPCDIDSFLTAFSEGGCTPCGA